MEASTSAICNKGYNNMATSEPKDMFWPLLLDGEAAGTHLAEINSSAHDALRSSRMTLTLNPAGNPVPSITAIPTAPSLPLVLPSVGERPRPKSQPIQYTIQCTEGDSRPCDCFSRLHSTMERMLSLASMHGPPLDTVLDTNRTAARICIMALECRQGLPIGNHVDLTSIACGLLDRLLSLYEAALSTFSAAVGFTKPDEEDGLQAADESGKRIIGAESLPLRLGSFAVERSEQLLWAKEIVIREIIKLRETLESYSRKGQDVRSVLLSHLARRCTQVMDEIRG